MTLEPAQIADQGKQAFESKNFIEAAELFRQAAEGFTAGNSALMAAEMMNNMSVALLQAGRAQEALNAALGTDQIFAEAKDIKRQGMAVEIRRLRLKALTVTMRPLQHSNDLLNYSRKRGRRSAFHGNEICRGDQTQNRKDHRFSLQNDGVA